MTSFRSIGSRRSLLATTVLLATLAAGFGAVVGPASGQTQGIDRSVVPLAADAPERYVVQPGDTLWDISARFLRDPWYWPEVWYVNPQVANPHLIYPGDVLALIWVDGRPRLVLERGGPLRLSPRVRAEPLSEAIHAIPYDRIAAFMSRPTVLAKEQVVGAPYVVRGRDDRLISATGDDLYVRRFGRPQPGSRHNVYNVGAELRDPDDGNVLGYQGLFTAQADVTRPGDPVTVRIVSSARETLEGDILLPDVVDVPMDFIPRPPPAQVAGSIMSVVDERSVVAENDILIINRGSRHGLKPGHVLAIWEAGQQVRDRTKHRESGKVELPDERNGLFMVFKTFDRMSYGLALEASREIHVGDTVRAP